MNALLTALQFLTRLPIRSNSVWSPDAWGGAVVWYPWVGLLIGLLAALPLYVMDSSWLAAALSLLVWVALTGALHLDGLADLADAWVGGHGDRDKTVAIMKDPRSGPMAIAMVVLVLLLKFAALATLAAAPHNALLWALVLAPAWGRAAAAIQLLVLPAARAEGLAASIQPLIPRRRVWHSLAGGLLLSLLLMFGLSWLWLAAFALLLWLLQRAYLQRLGGISGDLLGATIEVTETALLVVAAASV